MRKGNILPIALMAFAIVGFLVMVDYSISGGKWPWSPATTNEVVQTTTNTNSGTTNELTTYTSTAFGISFQYAPNGGPEFPSAVGVKETGNTVYVYYQDSEPEDGQFVRVFSKDASTPLADAIAQQFLKGYSSKDCFVADPSSSPEPGMANAMPSPWIVKVIGFPITDNNTDPWWAIADKCPTRYTTTNGISYFAEDPNFPTKFFYFSIGQYIIPAKDSKGWAETVIVTSPTADWKTYTNTVVGYSVKYPKTLVPTECEKTPGYSFVVFDKQTSACGEALGLFDIAQANSDSIQTWKNVLTNVAESTVAMDSITAQRIQGTLTPGMDSGNKDVILVKKNLETIRLQYNDQLQTGADQQTFNTLVSTFTFTK